MLVLRKEIEETWTDCITRIATAAMDQDSVAEVVNHFKFWASTVGEPDAAWRVMDFECLLEEIVAGELEEEMAA